MNRFLFSLLLSSAASCGGDTSSADGGSDASTTVDATTPDSATNPDAASDANPVDAAIDCTTTLSGGSVSTAVKNAKAGDTICLNTATYTSGTITSSFSSAVTVIAAPGQSPVVGSTVFGGGASNITFANMTLDGAQVGGSRTDAGQSATHIHFVGVTFSAGLLVFTPSNADQDTLVQNSTFENVGQATYEGRLNVVGNNNSANNGVVIEGNVFGNPNGLDTGVSDGIDLLGGTYGTVIKRNQFLNILESKCVPTHCDAIQPYGESHTSIVENFFYGDSTDIAGFDGLGPGASITGNVIVEGPDTYPGQIYVGGDSGGITITHNTIIGLVKFCDDPSGNNCNSDSAPNTGITLENNIITKGVQVVGTATYAINDYDLCSGCAGAHSISGAPAFVGGAKPTTWAGYALTSTSPGHGAASDALDMGATYFGQ